jgi:hypothetical protein
MSNFDYEKIKNSNKISTERYIQFCTELNSELLSSVQEINIIIKNLFDCQDKNYEVPPDINDMLKSLYKKSSDFNTYMLDLMEDEYFTFLPEED